MKKRNTIWIFLILLLLVVVGLYSSRNQWAGYLLKRKISNQTNGNVTLSYNSIHLNVFKKRLIITDPTLDYKNTFIDPGHAIRLERTKFKELSIYDLFLWNFFIRREYICRELTIVQPSFQLASADSAKNKMHFDPSIWLRIIEKHRLAALPIKFQIQHTYVKLGKMKLGKTKTSGESGGADYSIAIQGLGNLDNIIASNEVFYKKLDVKIHNFFRNSRQRNFSLKVDSISFSSLPEEFVISGVHYKPESENKANNLKLNIRQARIVGISVDSATKTFHIKAVYWNGGSVVFPEGKLAQLFSRKKTHNRKGFEEIFKKFPFLDFDTMSINKVQVYRIGNDSDTVLSINNFNIKISKAHISEKTFSDPLEFMTFSSLNTNLMGFHLMNTKKGIKINSKDIRYQSEKKLISVDSLIYEKYCEEDDNPIWKFYSDEMNIQGFSAEQFRKGEKQNISAELLNPKLQIWDNKLCSLPGNQHSSGVFDKLNFSKLNLKKGSVQYFGKKKGTFNLSGLDFFAGNLKRSADSSGKFSFSYDTLYFRANQSELTNPKSSLKMSTGVIKWLGRDLSVNNIELYQKQNGNMRNLSVPTADFSGLKLNALIFEKRLTGNKADLYDPNIRILQRDSLNDADTIPFSKKQLSSLPLKIAFSEINIRKGHLNLTVLHSYSDSLNLNTGVDLTVNRLKMGYDKNQLIFTPANWTVILNKTSFKNHQVSGKLDSATLNSTEKSLDIKKLSLFNRDSSSGTNIKIEVPDTKLSTIDYSKLFRSDSLVFGKIALQDATMYFTNLSKFEQNLSLDSNLKETTILFDSVELNRSDFTIERKFKSSDLKITGRQLNVLYKPLFRSVPHDSVSKKDFLKKWDISLKNLRLSDTLNNIQVVADGIALQSKYNQLSIDSISGSNIPKKETLENAGKDYADFKLLHMKFSGLQLKGKDFRQLDISRWSTPEVWVSMIHGVPAKKNSGKRGLIFSFLNKSTGFIDRVHIDSTQFDKLNFKFLYDNRKKLINIYDVGLAIHDIEVDSTLESDNPNYLFKDLRLDSHGKAFLSGDSMYTFRTRDVRVNLPLKKISFDSITVTPRYKKEAFFEKAKTQTDRVTAYGKSIDFDNFDFSTLLSQKVFHVGDISLNNFNVLFERDKHYPISDSIRPMPVEMLRSLPYKFYADTIRINHGFISYYEYQKKSSNPGIFFINNFNVYFLKVTDDFAHLDSAAVLKIHGSGQMMRTTGLNFVLVMPYFSPDDRFWFSAQTGNTDLSQFNSLSQNIIGISIVSGTGNADVQYVTGNNEFAKGNILFQYKNLKLRLYNRKKAKTSKGMGSPFVNFMLNNLMIRANNPKFLKPPRKGIVYFERDPHKSFINYLWKSSFSGITSTMGFNSRQQRQEKKTERQEAKSEE
ncbi:MAG: hypothetical protein IH595_11285 [Bacteroidales bacterium]|nr:hypothetical protein [Bacteroidales bacterium]